MQTLEEIANGGLCSRLDGIHVFLDRLHPVLGEQGLDQADATSVGGNLGLEVGQVVTDASRTGAARIL